MIIMNRVTTMKQIHAALALAAAVVAIPAIAHHSTAAYDYTKEVSLQGSVVEFQWTNPHMFIRTQVANQVWNIECGTPNINVRHGWKKTDIKKGDKITLKIAPMRDGTTGGTLFSVKLADGRTLFGPATDSRTLGFGRVPS